MPALTREMALVVACCRWPPSPDRDAAVRAAAPEIDWTRFERLTARHRVRPLVYPALAAAGISLPPTSATGWAMGVLNTARRNDLLAREGIALQAMLELAGIASLIVKGAPLAMLAYGELAQKHAKDIDLLVGPADVPAAIELLQQAGYVMWHPAASLSPAQLRDVLRYDREIEFRHDRHHRLQLELHWGLSRNRHILPGLDATAPTQQVDLGGGRIVRTLQRDDLFAYLCVHGASHGWFRLKWLADVAAFAGKHDIEQLYRAAVERGVAQSAGQALLLAHDLQLLALPPALLAVLRGDARVVRLVRAARDLIAGRGAEREIPRRRFGQLRLQYAQWLLTRDFRDLRANLAQYMTVTGDVLAVPLPPRLHFLYPLLRIPLGIGRLARRGRSGSVDHA